MSADESAGTNWAGLISSVLVQISLGFGVGLIAAFAALFASGHEPDLPLSGWLVLSPTWLLPVASLALINYQRVVSASTPFNVTLFLFAAFVGELAVAGVISAAHHA